MMSDSLAFLETAAEAVKVARVTPVRDCESTRPNPQRWPGVWGLRRKRLKSQRCLLFPTPADADGVRVWKASPAQSNSPVDRLG